MLVNKDNFVDRYIKKFWPEHACMIVMLCAKSQNVPLNEKDHMDSWDIEDFDLNKMASRWMC